MSEESKSPEGDYVMLEVDAASMPAGTKIPGLDDPGLSQEDRDHRLAIALQQQENAAAQEAQTKSKAVAASRTARSSTFTRLAKVRSKDHGMLTVPAEYTTENAYKASGGGYLAPTDGGEATMRGATPQQVADYQLAKELQKVEQAGAGTAREASNIAVGEATEESKLEWRTKRGTAGNY